ncbi:MAG TPA: PP0621 family protein [Gammaproteobacteria bacterium]
MRLLILLAAIFFLLSLASRWLLPRRARKNTKNGVPEKMVPCAWCQLYLPESEAKSSSGKFFCDRRHHNAWLEQQHSEKK